MADSKDQMMVSVPEDLQKKFKAHVGPGLVSRTIREAMQAILDGRYRIGSASATAFSRIESSGLIDVVYDYRTNDFMSDIESSRELYLFTEELSFFFGIARHRYATHSRAYVADTSTRILLPTYRGGDFRRLWKVKDTDDHDFRLLKDDIGRSRECVGRFQVATRRAAVLVHPFTLITEKRAVVALIKPEYLYQPLVTGDADIPVEFSGGVGLVWRAGSDEYESIRYGFLREFEDPRTKLVVDLPS